MGYLFSKEKFIENFNAKPTTEKSKDSIRLTHKPDGEFKLFPFKASGKTQAPIVINLEDVVSDFFKESLGKKTSEIEFDSLIEDIKKEIDIEDEDSDCFKDMIQKLFFKGNKFIANNIGLYPYQTVENNKSIENLAHFLYSVLGVNKDDCKIIKAATDGYRYNVVEKLVVEAIEKKQITQADQKKPYFSIKTDVQDKFRKDFRFMLEAKMTTLEDISNLFSLYYFYYVSQTCITLDNFCTGDRNSMIELYYALDWERVSKNRLCCESGWERLQGSVSHMFSHAITLEILNQKESEEPWDYIEFQKYVDEHPDEDEAIASQIEMAEDTYCAYVGDYKNFKSIRREASKSKTEAAIRHLFKCVEVQFTETERRRANQFYSEKYTEFCKARWIKNRRKSGLVLNLTERDVIFLTKIALRHEDKIRLNDLYKEYEYRGVFLDNLSKEYIQEFFTKLNLIDKKSDSGDAQYVKRIL